MIRLLAAFALPLSALCRPVATPSFEVKFNLVKSVLSSGAPGPELVSAFALQPATQERTWTYYDTPAKELNAEGWVVRLRHNQGGDLDLTYKKRFPVDDGLDAAIAAAKAQGFDAEDPKTPAEVDWTYAKQTLSFSQSIKESAPCLPGTALPSEGLGLELLLDRAPGRFEDWKRSDWGEDTLEKAHQFGPVTAKVWFGKWNGVQVLVEVLPVRTEDGSGTELNTELSFEVEDEAAASSLRDKAIKQLEDAGWLDKAGKLKTALILDRY